MRLGWVVLAAVTALFVTKSRSRDHLLLRAYASDYFVDPGLDGFGEINTIAAQSGLPPAWIADLRSKGSTGAALQQAASEAVSRSKGLALPISPDPVSLAGYKAAVLEA